MPDEREWRAGYHAAVKAATRPAPPRPPLPTVDLDGALAALARRVWAESIPAKVRELARTNPTVAAHLNAFRAGMHHTLADALASMVVSLAALNNRYQAAELRRAVAAFSPLTLTAEEYASLRISVRAPVVDYTPGVCGYVETAPREPAT